MQYAYATIRIQGQPIAVLASGGRYWSLAALAPDLFPADDGRGLMAMMERWPAIEPALHARWPGLLDGATALPAPASPDDILAPLLYPGKVCCTGANYRQHVGEVGLSKTFDKGAVRPSLFFKPPRTAVVGSGRSVRYPEQTAQFDWEIELAVVIGTKARHVPAAEAMDCVAGYTVGVDLSARDYLLHAGNMSGFDTFGGKGFDDSCPLGPAIVPRRFVPDPQRLGLRLEVNGQVRQRANTAEMIWSVAEQIAEMSAILTLEPGDVILTGTPAGSGLSSGTFLRPHDRVRAEIEDVGRLEFEIVPSPWAGMALERSLRTRAGPLA